MQTFSPRGYESCGVCSKKGQSRSHGQGNRAENLGLSGSITRRYWKLMVGFYHIIYSFYCRLSYWLSSVVRCVEGGWGCQYVWMDWGSQRPWPSWCLYPKCWIFTPRIPYGILVLKVFFCRITASKQRFEAWWRLKVAIIPNYLANMLLETWLK